jgi:hypothetical protein
MHSSRTIASRERLTAVVYDFGAAQARLRLRQKVTLERPPCFWTAQQRATHALFALKVQRKVSNGVAGLATGGASLDRQTSRQFVTYSDAARWPNTGAERLLKIPAARGPSGISPQAQLLRDDGSRVMGSKGGWLFRYRRKSVLAQVKCQSLLGGPKKGATGEAARSSNREASNRVDRSHSMSRRWTLPSNHCESLTSS